MRMWCVARGVWRVAEILIFLLLVTRHSSLVTSAWAAPLSDTDPHLKLFPVPSLPWGHDPFSERDRSSMPRTGMPGDVSAIFFHQDSPSRSFAIMEGRTVRVGDDIRGREIVEIARDKVIISDEERLVELRVAEEGGERPGEPRFSLKQQGSDVQPPQRNEDPKTD